MLLTASIAYRRPYIMLTNGEVRIYSSHESSTFLLTYIHSVNQSPVTEVYEIRQGQIVLVSLEFESFGAGMPTVLEPGQEFLRLPGGGMRIENFNRVIGEELRVMAGYGLSQIFLFSGTHRVMFDDVAEPGQVVRVSFRWLNLWQRLYFLFIS